MFKKNLKNLARRLYKIVEYQRSKTLIHKNISLKNKFSGKRVFILGNGASLNDIDLSLLKEEYTIGCNYIVLHKDFPKLNLSFYADPASKRSIWATEAPKTILARGPVPTGTVKDGFLLLDKMTRESGTQLFFDTSMKKYIDENRLFANHDIFYVMSGNGLEEGKKVELNLTKPLSTMEGALFFMINLAFFMGFKEIYLCGCGYTYAPQKLFHFYETKTGTSDDTIDPRHQILQKIAVQKDVAIFNVVPEGFQSPVYRPISWREVEESL